MNKQVEGWEYGVFQYCEAWTKMGSPNVSVYRFFTGKPKWGFLNSKNKWEFFPRHVNTLDKRLQYALAVCRLED